MAQLSMKSLIESGVHYGHLARKWNPKMKPFIFGIRNQVHIINLQHTIEYARKAGEFVYNLGKSGKILLMVGTKAQAQEVVTQTATQAGAFYVTQRWLGGTLTNFAAIRGISENYQKIKNLLESEEGNKLIKKERTKLEKDNVKKFKYIQGILNMSALPDAIYVVDIIREAIAIREASRLNIPIVALVDTNTDPDTITYPIPGNDDALKSISLFTQYIAESYQEGRQLFLEQAAARAKDREAQKEKETVEAATSQASAPVAETSKASPSKKPAETLSRKERPRKAKPQTKKSS